MYDHGMFSGDTKVGSSNCATCDKTSGVCQSCVTGYAFDFLTGSCLHCADGFYNATGDALSLVCDPCLIGVAVACQNLIPLLRRSGGMQGLFISNSVHQVLGCWDRCHKPVCVVSVDTGGWKLRNAGVRRCHSLSLV